MNLKTLSRLRAAAIIVGVVLAAPALRAQTPSESAIRALEARRTTALTRSDVATLKELLDDGLTHGHSSGAFDTKTSLIARLSSGELKYRSIEEKDVTIRFYGDAAVLKGTAAIVASGANSPEALHNVAFTSVWARTKGAWHFVAWQSAELK